MALRFVGVDPVPGEVIVYLRAFDQLARLAVYGSEARALITDAISALV